LPIVRYNDATIGFPDDMPPEEVQGVLGRAFSNFARDIDTAKTHLSRLAEGSVIVGAVRGMRPEDQAALATSMVPGVGDAAGLYADYTDIRENWDQVPWYDKAGMVGAAALGAVPFVPSRSQVNAGAEVARGMTIAYHGSPHDFPPVRELQMPDGARVYQSMDNAIPEGAKMLKEHPLGRFNMSKIGTGEGAQAYGHGLYFAEAEATAKGYRDRLAADIDVSSATKMLPDKYKGSNDNARRMLTEIDNALATKDIKSPSEFIDVFDVGEDLQPAYKEVARLMENKGSMYQVEIDASPDEFLDWDLPLSEQSIFPKEATSVKAARYKEEGLSPTPADMMQARFEANAGQSGEGFYNGLLRGNKTQAEATSALQNAGIKGIRYKDGFSRGPDGGTSNYVVFDENLISIARKYGIAIPAAAAMLARQTGQNPQDMYEDDST
jgi:hypothetical protein